MSTRCPAGKLTFPPQNEFFFQKYPLGGRIKVPSTDGLLISTWSREDIRGQDVEVTQITLSGHGNRCAQDARNSLAVVQTSKQCEQPGELLFVNPTQSSCAKHLFPPQTEPRISLSTPLISPKNCNQRKPRTSQIIDHGKNLKN